MCFKEWADYKNVNYFKYLQVGIDGASPLLVYKEASMFQLHWDTSKMSVPDKCSIWKPFDQSKLIKYSSSKKIYILLQ